MGIEEAVGKFSWKLWGKKVVGKVLTGAASCICGKASAVGLDIDQAQLTATFFVAFEAARNLLKHQFPKQLGWL